MRLPANSPTTLQFGATTDPYSPQSPHMGTDFAYLPDKTIYAPFTGKVILRPNNGRDGNGIYMYNGDQFHGMLHSSQYLVSDGQTVTEGQPIGVMGDTGFAQGVHLHWCVKENGQFIDPMTLVEHISKGDTMALTPGQLDRLIKGILGREPTQEELSNAEYLNNPGLAIETFWNNGGADRYSHPGNSSAAQDKVNQIKKIVES